MKETASIDPPARTGAMFGYADPRYAETLREFGDPVRLANCEGHILKRRVPGSDLFDAMGVYPLFQCRHWDQIGADLESLRTFGLVSLVLVSDPMMLESERAAFDHFDVVRPFKRHFVTELDGFSEQSMSSHHRRYTRKAARTLSVDLVVDPLKYLDEWCRFYEVLCRRHGIGDLRAFSTPAFEALFRLENVIYMRALKDGVAVGGQVYVCTETTVFAHLSAYSESGYEHGASYILDRVTIDHFKGRKQSIDWGGGLCAYDQAPDGLAWYKKGWSTSERTSYLLGSVLDPETYEFLVRTRDPAQSSYFPAYRAGEFKT